ncbi:hypothetical protein LTR36_005965 [Oleoguttula mirabilis]|uniref:U3 small nucleolar RNA-associated protein 14 n=1 Tax=Oleoguttula mirabilis TaxID=1507867 RepID=A0AAV9JES5_9PEZI|nr:hypothetical protein LTR36_005965 [Oleoguttula mirabilis]
MPPRLARANVAVAAPKSGKNKNRKRNLDAYSIASHAIKPRRTVAAHRLGESIDDNPRQKRRKVGEDDDDDGEEDDADEDDGASRKKSRGRGIGEESADGVEEGSDSEGNEWTLGGLAEDDEDSDLDSEEAFGESDEEKFEGFTFRGSSTAKGKKPVKKKQRAVAEDEGGEIDLDEAGAGSEGDDEEASDFGDEGVDLATMLDDEDEDMLAADDESDSDEDTPSEADSDDDDDADNEERIARLRDRVEAMDAKTSRAATPADETATLSIDDLLADLDPAAKKQYAAALKTKKKSQAPKTLTAPLPKRQQDRINREAASQKATEQLDRWRDTVIHNRRAEFLSFPLQDPDRAEPIGKEKFDTQGAPQNELERNIQRIMEESGMATKPGQQVADEEEAEEVLMKAEELGVNHLPVEEVMRRRAELRRARELLFREEIKAKRVAKIKSKSYRRVHRKERERQAGKERALMDPEGLGLPLDEDEREVADRKRAEERMGTKHRESKWAKSLKASNRTVWDEGARGSVNEQARRQEELRRRIAGEEVGRGGSGDGSASDSGDDDDDDDAATLRQLGRLKRAGGGAQPKGVSGMKFMREAEGRLRARNEEDIERLRKELAVLDGEEEDRGSGAEGAEDAGLGRAIFGPQKGKQAAAGVQGKAKKVTRAEMEEGDASEDGSEGEQGEGGVSHAAQRPKPAAPKGILKKASGGARSGPLVAKGLPLPRDRRDPEAGQAAPAPPAQSAWLDVSGTKTAKKGQGRERDVSGDIDVGMSGARAVGDDKMKPARAASKTVARAGEPAAAAAVTTNNSSGASASNTDGWTTVTYPTNTATDDDDAATGSGAETEDPMLNAAQQKQALHRRAFAGDDVHLAFAADKAADAADEGEHEVSTHVPGWGSWAGEGLSKSLRKANARQRHNPLFKTRLPGGVKAEERQDARKGMERVIVSEKRDRKGKVYLAPVLPHGFEAREQYERSLRVPVGPEWTTKEVFQRGTRPRVVVRPGVVVGAMEKPLV